MKKRLFSPLLAAALAAAVALTAAALPAFADGGEETPITIGQSQEQQAECTCTVLCTGDSVNADCPVYGAEEADLTACEGLEVLPATLSNALPATALAAEVDAPNNLYVGNQNVKKGNDTTYWNTNNRGELIQVSDATDGSNDWTVKYDPNTATLTLKNATIKTTHDGSRGAMIYAQSVGSRAVSLTIQLVGENTIVCDSAYYGIYVDAEMSNDSYGTDASLTITGNGSLEVSGSSYGIWVKSGTGNASLNIKNVAVTSSTNGDYAAGVCVQSSTKATGSPQLSLAVDGGSLTTSASEGNDGIQFYVGLFEATGATTSLTVADNAIVRAKNGIKAERVDKPTPSGAGIVFDGTEGTVYGDVTLQTDLEIGEGESLTIPDGASLNTDGRLTVDGGTLTGKVTGDVIYKVTGVKLNKNTTTIKVGGTETLTATVEPANATNKAVTWSSDNISVATVDANGLVTAVAEGSATITVTTEDGSKTATCTVIVTNNGSGPVVPPQPSDPAPSQPEGGGSSSAGAGSSGSSAPRQQSPVVHNVSNSSAYRKGEYEFWMKVRTKIVSAGPGEVIEVNARDNDKMPNSVMQALAAKEDVTLRIRWNGGEEIVIPSAAALQEKMRMFYPLSYLAKFDFAQTPAKRVK